MRDGTCPKCGSSQVFFHPAPAAVPAPDVALDQYACMACGYAEIYLSPLVDRAALRASWHAAGARITEPLLSAAQPSTRTIRLPPMQFGTARILAYGPLDERTSPTPLAKPLRAPGSAASWPAYVAFYQYPQSHEVHRCYCDSRWNILQQDVFPYMSSAIAALDLEYQGAANLLIPFGG